ncbi:MAG TPA: beta-ketoacyl-[acyl-carrier-protein] synthase family protein [Polyangiaceae bacterium]|nr:beta-ketoacyl-[acyl-carrier-protein] synthase family protein [Polyangiaceae bacterium]
MRRVVITSVGVMSAIGRSFRDFTAALLAGSSGARWLKDGLIQGDAVGDVRFAAFIPGFPLGARTGEINGWHRSFHFAVHAIRQLVERAPLVGDCGRQVGLCSGVGIGQLFPESLSLPSTELIAWREAIGRPNGFDTPSAIRAHADSSTVELVRRFDFGGLAQTFMGTCSAATHACLQAVDEVRDGAELCIGGGHDSLISMAGLHFMHGLGTLASEGAPEDAVKPFDLNRDGTIVGEGAAYFLFEEYEHAVRRRAPIFAEVLGGAASLDGYHVTAPDPGCEAGIRMLRDAIECAGIRATDVDYVNAHGTGTVANDGVEARIIREGLSGHDPLVSSSKPQVGHLIGACGAIELAACLSALREQRVPPNRNLRNPDPECPLRLPMGPAAVADIDVVLTNSFGFGGQNSCMILRRAQGTA